MKHSFIKSLLVGLSTLVYLGCLTFVSCQRDSEELLAPEEGEELSGGSTTVSDLSFNAFGHVAPNIVGDGKARFVVGNSFFKQNWVMAPSSTTGRDGLGPMLNALSCSGCHDLDGRGRPPMQAEEPLSSLLLRLSIPGTTPQGGPVPDPTYGDQFNGRAIQGVKWEGDVSITYQEITGTFPDGEPYSLRKPTYHFNNLNYGNLHSQLMVSPRVAQHMVGLGLLEAVDETTILAVADPQDSNGDGISGKPNYVWDVENNKTSLGRFGWKANQPNLKQQVAAAFVGDIGITSALFPVENCTSAQADCQKSINGNTSSQEPYELTANTLDQVVYYSATLAVPARRDWKDQQVLQGKKLFMQANCTACHIPKMTTSHYTPIPELSNQTIRPYTDLLLHDMGPELADNRPDFLADGQEWRTSPLWGIGLIETVNGHTFFMHDGRARNLTEAILWHGGEAQKSKNAFMNMAKSERTTLLKFLESL